jgi:hypothetical protein
MIDLYDDVDSAFSALYDYSCKGTSSCDENLYYERYRYQSVDGEVQMYLSSDCYIAQIIVGDQFHVIRDLNKNDWFKFVKGEEKAFIEFASILVPAPTPTTHWHLTCEKCYKKNSSVEQIIDPFEYDINNREVLLATLCADCYSKDYELQQTLHDLAMEI